MNGLGAEVSGVAHGESSAGCFVHISSKLAVHLREHAGKVRALNEQRAE